jgi:PAS domain S-box-containing protein
MIKYTEDNKRVVIAEDSATQAEKLKFSLQNLGLEVFHGINGREAGELIKEVDPVMIISDVMMPEMDGYELVKLVRSKKEFDHIPFILLTTLSDLNDVLQGLEYGADSYIMKPFNEHYLLSRLNQVMENRNLISDRGPFDSINFEHLDKEYNICSSAPQILNLLFSSYESAIYRNIEMEERENEMLELNRTLTKDVEHRKRDLNTELQQIIKAEKSLKKSEAKFKGLIDYSHLGIYMTTLDGKITLSNNAFCSLLGYKEESLSQISFQELFVDPQEGTRLIENVVKENKITEYETRLITKEKEFIDVLVNANIVGKYVSGMVLDITERKRAEEQMKITREELVKAKEKAEASEKLKNSFIANMSNEILAPLNSLIGFTKLIEAEELSSENMLEYTDQINLSGNNLINIIENVIDIAKVESGELVLKKGDCYVNRMLLDLYSLMKEKLIEMDKSSLGIFVKRENKDPDFTMFTEPYRLKRILVNLLNNAVKYTEEGEIGFGYKLLKKESVDESEKIQFFVRDTGRGMQKDKMKSLFDRFNQDELSFVKDSEGAGLGLPLARAYVEMLGGEIWCESTPGKGSTFYFTLEFQQLENSPKAVKKQSVQKAHNDKEGIKVLIAEDNGSNYYLLEAMLGETGAKLIWAKNGKEAVEYLARDKTVDLVLMDLQMPVMSGQEAVKEIRKTNKTLPIIAQTAFAREEDRAEIIAIGCTSVLIKPIIRVDLLNEIGRLFDQNIKP